MQKADGMMYAPKGKPNPVCQQGEFRFAAVGLDHGHIYGMSNGLTEAGGELVWVYDPDPAKVKQFCDTYPGVKAASNEAQVLEDESIQLIAGAAVTSERGPMGLRVQSHGKHYLSDKAPFTTFDQLEQARASVKETSLIWSCCYSERVHNESAVFAGQLIKQGVIGKVLQVTNIAPHRLNAKSRPAWFFEKEKYGGILCDIGSHQCEQFLSYTGAKDAQVNFARVANFGHQEFPELEDFGEASLIGDNGTSFYFRVDWFTPDGLRTWGDGRTMILGSEGTIELRKYVDIGNDRPGNQLYLFDQKQEVRIDAKGTVGHRFFSQFIRDCLDRTELAMSQEHAFKAAELCLKIQQIADA